MRRRASPAVAVTGAGSGLGRALVERLVRRDDLAGVIAVDAAPGRTEGVTWRAADPRDPLLAERLTGATTVVHLATSYDARAEPVERAALNVRGTEAVLAAARAVGAQRVVLVTSAEVYASGGPRPLGDDAPLRDAVPSGLLAEQLEVERLAAASKLPVAVLRPATLVGGPLGASYDGTLLRHLSAPRLLAARGSEPLWQLCHADDLLAALEVAVVEQLVGPAAVACAGWLPQSAVEQIAGKSRFELPAGVARSTAERLHRLGITTGPPYELDHLDAPLIVGCDRLRGLGWEPRWTNEEALRAYVANGVGSDGRAGAYTAAGATVALLGTAALVRQARRRRRR